MREHAQRSEAATPLLDVYNPVSVEAQEDDMAVAVTIFQGVVVSSLCVILVGLSISMFVVSEHCFTVIFLGCFNIAIICPLVTSNETELIGRIQLEKRVRKLKREKQWLDNKIYIEKEKYRTLNDNDQQRQQLQELLTSIVALQKGKKVDEVILLAKENLELTGHIKVSCPQIIIVQCSYACILQRKVHQLNRLINLFRSLQRILRSKAVERMVQIISSYYHTGKLILSGDEVNDAITRIIKYNSESVTLNEREFRRALQRFGHSFGGIYQVLYNILMGNYDGQNILLVKFQPVANIPKQHDNQERTPDGDYCMDMSTNKISISQ